MKVNFIFQTNFHCFVFQLNSDEFLNVDLLLEEAMHALVIGPLTSRLRDSLRQNLMEKKSNPSQEPLTSNSDDNSEVMKNEVAFVKVSAIFTTLQISKLHFDQTGYD